TWLKLWIVGQRRCASGCQRRFSRCASRAYRDEFFYAPTRLSFETAPVTNLVGGWGWVGLGGVVPPTSGALAGGAGARWDRGRGKVRRTRQRSCTKPLPGAVGDDESVCGSGDGDNASMVQPVVIRA